MILIGENGKTREFKLRHFRFSAAAKEVTDYLSPAELDLIEEYMISTYGNPFTAIEINKIFEWKLVIQDYAEVTDTDKVDEIWHRRSQIRSERYKLLENILCKR